MDYLSFLTLRQESCPNYPELDGQDYIVLNSVSNVNKALYPLGSYERIHCLDVYKRQELSLPAGLYNMIYWGTPKYEEPIYAHPLMRDPVYRCV